MAPYIGNGMDSEDTAPESLKVSVHPGYEHRQQWKDIGHTLKRLGSYSSQAEEKSYDLVCVGFGPASLAIAVAMNDAVEGDDLIDRPKACFLERQKQFGWHAGMLLPGTKMQISFIKDFASLRDPRSEFTFLNYLKRHNRLVEFTNLGTFLPSRTEFEDYMAWCASHFTDQVEYGTEVLEISAVPSSDIVERFAVKCRNVNNNTIFTRKASNIVIAIGGTPHIPENLWLDDPRVNHSSQYAKRIDSIISDRYKEYSIAVVGSGQSGAEIFHDIQQRYPNARTRLIIRDTALRPSDDSPFVNEIFNPERADEFYHGPARGRANVLSADRATNYSVVRLELIEQIYQDLYHQRIKESDETKWRHRILRSQQVIGISKGKSEKLVLSLKDLNPLKTTPQPGEDSLEVDAVFLATGYRRNAHEKMLRDVEHLHVPGDERWGVRRDYKVEMDESKVSPNAGIWLQGCNESTHGLSDTLLSTLATRGGEMVDSIFGTAEKKEESSKV